MKNKNNNDLFGKCPYATAQKIFSSKWALLVIYNLSRQKLRFGELRRNIPNLTQATLTRQLRTLEEYGLINRKIYPQIPPKVEYSLTTIGQEFIPVLEQFEIFGKKYIDYLNDKFK